MLRLATLRRAVREPARLLWRHPDACIPYISTATGVAERILGAVSVPATVQGDLQRLQCSVVDAAYLCSFYTEDFMQLAVIMCTMLRNKITARLYAIAQIASEAAALDRATDPDAGPFVCLICTEDKRELYASTSCVRPHLACRQCWDAILARAPRCPFCRTLVTHNDLMSTCAILAAIGQPPAPSEVAGASSSA